MVEIRDREVLSRFLLADPITNAYPLGDLDPAWFGYCRWFAERDEPFDSLVLLYSGLSLPVVMTCGDATALTEVVRGLREVLPPRFQYHAHGQEHLDALSLFFRTQAPQRMVRMALRREDYERPAGEPDPRVVRLGHSDTGRIIELFRHYPDNFFEPYQLESNLYFGVMDGERLVSIAGIHVVCEEFDVACIGNLVTAPDHRGRGLATACTARLLDELFERVSLVALNTGESNEPAQRTFARLGFTAHNHYFEGRVEAA